MDTGPLSEVKEWRNQTDGVDIYIDTYRYVYPHSIDIFVDIFSPYTQQSTGFRLVSLFHG